MRLILLVILNILFAGQLLAQDDVLGVRKCQYPVKLKCISYGRDTVLVVTGGDRIIVTEIIGQGVDAKIVITTKERRIIECIAALTEILLKTEKDDLIDGGFTLGMLTIPSKLQLDDTDLRQSTNLGISFGYQRSHRMSDRITYSIVASACLTGIQLNSWNTKGATSVPQGVDFLGVSYSIGWLLQYEKIQFGIHLGADRLNEAAARQFQWIHQGKLWLGLGIGINIFSPTKISERNGKYW